MKHAEHLMPSPLDGSYVWRSPMHSLAAATGLPVGELGGAGDDLRSMVARELTRQATEKRLKAETVAALRRVSTGSQALEVLEAKRRPR